MDPIKKTYLARDEDGREAMRNYRKPPVRFRASELAQCKRRLWYRLSGYLPKPRTGFQEDWSVDGDIHHDQVRQTLLYWGVALSGITQDEGGETHENKYTVQEFEHDGVRFKISSRQDGWIEHPDYDDHIMMEIKSVGHWPYHYMVKAYDEGFGPQGFSGSDRLTGEDGFRYYIYEKRSDFVYQINAGMAMHGDKHTYLVLKDRSNSHIGIHLPEGGSVGGVVFDYDQKVFDKIMRRCAAVQRAVTAGEPPMPEHPQGHKECKMCSYYYACHETFKRKRAGLTPSTVYPDPQVDVQFDEEETDGDV